MIKKLFGKIIKNRLSDSRIVGNFLLKAFPDNQNQLIQAVLAEKSFQPVIVPTASCFVPLLTLGC